VEDEDVDEEAEEPATPKEEVATDASKRSMRSSRGARGKRKQPVQATPQAVQPLVEEPKPASPPRKRATRTRSQRGAAAASSSSSSSAADKPPARATRATRTTRARGTLKKQQPVAAESEQQNEEENTRKDEHGDAQESEEEVEQKVKPNKGHKKNANTTTGVLGVRAATRRAKCQSARMGKQPATAAGEGSEEEVPEGEQPPAAAAVESVAEGVEEVFDCECPSAHVRRAHEQGVVRVIFTGTALTARICVLLLLSFLLLHSLVCCSCSSPHTVHFSETLLAVRFSSLSSSSSSRRSHQVSNSTTRTAGQEYGWRDCE
jgi:hypothetical protein